MTFSEETDVRRLWERIKGIFIVGSRTGPKARRRPNNGHPGPESPTWPPTPAQVPQERTKVPRRHGPKPDPKWDAVDWTCGDAEIAKALGVSRARVHQVRQRKGIPTYTELRKTRIFKQIEAMKDELPNLDAGQIAERLGLSRAMTTKYLRQAGYRAGRDYIRSRVAVGPRPHLWKYDWDSVDWENEYNSQIARRFGMAPEQVTMVRKRWGKPKGPDGRAVSPYRFSKESHRPEQVRRLFRQMRVLTARDLITLGVPSGTAYMVLNDLLEEGFLVRYGDGGRWSKYVYVITEEPDL